MDPNLQSSTASGVPNRWIAALLLLMIAPLTITAPYVLLEPEQPTSTVAFPEGFASNNQGYLLVVLDGVGENIMLDESLMPNLASRMDNSAVVSITTGPLTLSATCVREMMTGVPNAPIDGLKNFNMGHPGGTDPWLLAATSDSYSVGMIGSYVMGNLYGDRSDIEFVNTFEGHADYYEGDDATGDVLEQWLGSERHNVVAAHFSGPDKVGHKWGTVSEEYRNKMLDLDQKLSGWLRLVPPQWTVVVTADHGMTSSGSHGSAEPETREVLALVTGPDIDTSARTEAAQLDLAALMLFDLGLDFPSQVNGRIPLDVFSLSAEDRSRADAWNWEAGLLRHVFFNPDDADDYRLDEVDWEGIAGEPVVIRGLDVVVSVAVLSCFLLLGFLTVHQGRAVSKSERKHLILLGCIVAASVWFHANLSFSAMIPRAIGAAAVVWLVASSLGRTPALDVSWDRRLYDAKPWLVAGAVLSVYFGDLSRGLLVLLVLWVMFWSTGAMTGQAKRNIPSSTTVYVLAAMVAFSLGSLRLWYALIPLFMLLTGTVLDRRFRSRPFVEQAALWVAWGLVVCALSYVHRRMFGTHHLLKLVNLTPTTLLTGLVAMALLAALSLLYGAVYGGRNVRASCGGCFAVLLVALAASRTEWAPLQWIVLAGAVGLYVMAWLRRKDPTNQSVHFMHAALGVHVMVSWGPWATVASLALLIVAPHVAKVLAPQNIANSSWLNRPQNMVALAVLPWVVWILWWTLMGQVNGMQFCYEGVCPHPRELDPGAVRVQGGYYGGGSQPSTLWMALMVVSPLIAVSVALMHRLLKAGVGLQPYLLSQGVVVFGCLALYAFTPIYPRLVFSLTYNIVFAVAQIGFAAAALWIERFDRFMLLSGGLKRENSERRVA